MKLLHGARAEAMGNSYNNLPLSQRATVANEVATQTTYEPEDIQAMFIRRMDEILGMKVYRPVSRGAKPRLQAKDEKDEL